MITRKCMYWGAGKPEWSHSNWGHVISKFQLISKKLRECVCVLNWATHSTHSSHKSPTHSSHKCLTHLSHKCPIPISPLCLTVQFFDIVSAILDWTAQGCIQPTHPVHEQSLVSEHAYINVCVQHNSLWFSKCNTDSDFLLKSFCCHH